MFPFINIFGNRLSTFNLMIGLGAILGILFFEAYARKKNISTVISDQLLMVFVLSTVLGFVFGMLFDKVAHAKSFENFFKTFWQYTGMTFLGGLLGGIFAFILLYYCIFKNFNDINKHMDVIVPAFVLAQAFGRIGCFLGGCCYGIRSNSNFAIPYPVYTKMTGHIEIIRVLPTNLFEAIGLFILFAILVFLKKKNTFIFYCFYYGIMRFCIEFLRGDDRGTIWGSILSPSQYLSIFLFLIGFLILIIRKIRSKSISAKDYIKIH